MKFPRSFTYLRLGSLRTRKRRSRADTPHRCLDQPAGQPHLAEMVSPFDRPHCRRCPEARPLERGGSVTRSPADTGCLRWSCRLSRLPALCSLPGQTACFGSSSASSWPFICHSKLPGFPREQAFRPLPDAFRPQAYGPHSTPCMARANRPAARAARVARAAGPLKTLYMSP